jgi:glutathione S-transferase
MRPATGEPSGVTGVVAREVEKPSAPARIAAPTHHTHAQGRMADSRPLDAPQVRIIPCPLSTRRDEWHGGTAHDFARSAISCSNRGSGRAMLTAATNRTETPMAEYMLVSFKTCPWVQRSAIVLREKGVDFELRHIEPDNRPDWFLAISPHKKVPVLRIDDRVSLFESNAINEYLDETIPPRLHPADPVARAINRAWTDYVPTFASAVTGTAYADSEAEYEDVAAKIPAVFERLEKALERQGSGPYFNGAGYSLVDAAYAPFLQRYFYLDRIKKLGIIENYPRLAAWAKALIERPSTHSFPEAEFEAMYRDGLKRRNKWVSQFIGPARAAAE